MLTLILSGTTIDGCESRDLPCFHHGFSDFWPYGTSIQYTESIWTMIKPYKTTKLCGIYRPMIKNISDWWFQRFSIFHFIYGMSSFPLTNSYFSRWFFNHQPDRNMALEIPLAIADRLLDWLLASGTFVRRRTKEAQPGGPHRRGSHVFGGLVNEQIYG